MPLTADNSTALLNEVLEMATQKTQRVQADRAFYHKGEPIGVGSVLDLPAPIAAELRSANKVSYVASDTKLKASKEVPAPADASLPAGKDDSKASSKKDGGSK